MTDDNVQQILCSRAVGLNEGHLQHLTAVCKSENEESNDTVIEWFQLNTSAMKKGLQMADDFVDHLLEVDHFMDGA